MKRENTFGDYEFDDWVCEDVRKQIRDFWGCFGRTYKDWLLNFHPDEPEYGKVIYLLKGNSFFKGRFIHAWNNMGRIILDDGTYKVVSTCDTFLSEKPCANMFPTF